MKTNVGLWIDHRKAIVVTMTEAGEEVKEILSTVEKQPRRSGDSPLKGSYEAAQVPPDDRLQNAMTEHLNIYYDAVTDGLGAAESIFVFGPGEAKHELIHQLEGKHLGGRVVRVETTDQMSDAQVVAQVRQHFAPSKPRPQQGLPPLS
jgi:hypothetical protein